MRDQRERGGERTRGRIYGGGEAEDEASDGGEASLSLSEREVRVMAEGASKERGCEFERERQPCKRRGSTRRENKLYHRRGEFFY
jgi:hypothetical protein